MDRGGFPVSSAGCAALCIPGQDWQAASSGCWQSTSAGEPRSPTKASLTQHLLKLQTLRFKLTLIFKTASVHKTSKHGKQQAAAVGRESQHARYLSQKSQSRTAKALASAAHITVPAYSASPTSINACDNDCYRLTAVDFKHKLPS